MAIIMVVKQLDRENLREWMVITMGVRTGLKRVNLMITDHAGELAWQGKLNKGLVYGEIYMNNLMITLGRMGMRMGKRMKQLCVVDGGALFQRWGCSETRGTAINHQAKRFFPQTTNVTFCIYLQITYLIHIHYIIIYFCIYFPSILFSI